MPKKKTLPPPILIPAQPGFSVVFACESDEDPAPAFLLRLPLMFWGFDADADDQSLPNAWVIPDGSAILEPAREVETHEGDGPMCSILGVDYPGCPTSAEEWTKRLKAEEERFRQLRASLAGK